MENSMRYVSIMTVMAALFALSGCKVYYITTDIDRSGACERTIVIEVEDGDISETAYYNVCFQYAEFQHADGHYIAINKDVVSATTVALEPGADKEFDFTVDGPLTIPVRFVDDEGNPVEGVRTMIKNVDSGGQWGGTISGPDGRAVLRGLNPQYTYGIFGGGSEHHQVKGEPGETLPELVVTCQ